MPWLQEKWEALSERGRKKWEIALGILMALGGWFFLARSSSGDDSFIPMIAAVSCVILLPRIVETQTGHKLRLMHRSLLIALLVFIVATIIVALVSGESLFTPA